MPRQHVDEEKGDLEQLIHRTALAVAIILVATATLFFAIDLDGGLTLAMGMAIRAGYLPYRDFFENRTPALHFMTAGVLGIYPSLWLVRAFWLALNLGGACLAGRLAEGLAGRRARRWATLFYLLAVLLFQGYALVNEPAIAFLLLLAVWLAWERNQRPLAAAVAALTIWFKQPALLPAAVFVGALLHASKGRREQGLIAGAGLLAAAAPAVLLWRAGLAPAFLQQTVGANLQTAAARWPGLSEFGRAFLNVGATTGIFWVLCGLGLAEGLVLPAGRGKPALLGGLVLASLMTALPNLYLHYFFIAAALGSILAGAGVARLLEGLAEPRHRAALPALVFLPLLAQGAIPALSVLKQGYLFRQMAFARHIQEAAPPGEPILVLTYDPAYYFLAERYPPVPTFFLLWVNDTPELEQQLVSALGQQVHTAVLVEQPGLEQYGAAARARIRQCGTLVHADPGLQAEIWHVEGCP